ncbi:MAG: sigma-54 dependent transcriptional regulator [Armatimonadota bacterium]|nr:sigma-54 dependent transcriptional regulator [Armatimonadota bacterium]
MSEQNVLVIDDEKPLCNLFVDILSRDSYRVQTAHKGAEGLALLSDPAHEFGVVFTDVNLPDMTGIEVLKEIKRQKPHLPVVMITGFATKDAAVEAMRLGAYDYLAKPFNVADVSNIVGRALERNRLIDENRFLRNELRARYNFDNIVGSSEKVQAAYVLAAKVANQNATVLITGESGTGKEMLARTIHYQSKRADKPFVKVNCAALPEHLLEDELFGHEKGAFTDAHTQRIGRFEWAHGGTLFLDEIGEVSPAVQVKLLRALQEREFERIGSSKTIKVDVRLIAATNKNLHKALADGTFREDLFYRLNVVPIELPPLRERQEDIPLLVEHFIKKYCEETGRNITRVDEAAMRVLQEHEWRGNIRELENCIERAVILAEDEVIEARHLLLAPAGLNVQHAQTWAVSSQHAPTVAAKAADEPLPTLREAELRLIGQALERAQGDEAAAAKMLAIDVKTLRAKRESANGQASARAGSRRAKAS